MPDLTPQDRENYKKLQDAVTALKEKIGGLDGNISSYKTCKELIASLLQVLLAHPNTLEGLENRIDHVDGYLLAQKFLLATPPNNQAAIAQATQDVMNQVALIRASLQAVEELDLSTLDDLKPICTDDVFFNHLSGDPKQWTKHLLNGYQPNLNNNEIQQLTGAWETAVFKVAEDARKANEQNGHVTPGPDAIARFFCIHEELEALYDRLSALVA